MFYGIVIYLYFFDNAQHGRPHIHARFQDMEASVAIDDGAVLAGSLPASKLKLVLAWVEIHHDELMADWQLAVDGQAPFPIEPLR